MQPKLHPIFYIKMDNQDSTTLTKLVPTGDAVEFNIGNGYSESPSEVGGMLVK